MNISAQMEGLSFACTEVWRRMMETWPEGEPASNPVPTVALLAIIRAVDDPEWAQGFVASIPEEILSAVREGGMLTNFIADYDREVKRVQGSPVRRMFKKLQP